MYLVVSLVVVVRCRHERKAMKCPGVIVAMAAEAASATQLLTVAFDAGGAITGSAELDSCRTSRKYVINSPSS